MLHIACDVYGRDALFVHLFVLSLLIDNANLRNSELCKCFRN